MRNTKGFTLIELSIILAIIGILAAIAIAQYSNYRIGGYDTETKSVLHALSLAQEAYFIDNNTYSSGVTVLINDYAVETGGIMVTTPMIADNTSYHIEAQHPSSPNVYELDGPGGSIKKK